ncbi:VPLPA-CTERM sorting domain-containing protein [Desulfosarcina cetonica]|uniref:VPLPA-CTERM sorting domain-containing protein n=1 Tax=Desulfosarcina cetonica TaxID=90730 RepID=UPI0009F9868E
MSSDIVLDDRVQVAALTFTYDLQLLVDDGLPDFEAFYRSGQAMTFVEDGLPVTYQPESIGADLAAVPVPAAVWLLGSGLLGLVGLRRHDR